MSKLTIGIEMDATVENHKHLHNALYERSDIVILQYTLSEYPSTGEVWKNGFGVTQELIKFFDDGRYVIRSSTGCTYKSCGTWYSKELSMRNLVERVSQGIEITSDGYWLDRAGIPHRVFIRNDTVVEEGNGYFTEWTRSGRYNPNSNEFNELDLVQKMICAERCAEYARALDQVVRRTIIFTIETTPVLYRTIKELIVQLSNAIVTEYTLSELPQPGEVWLDGFGKSHEITGRYDDDDAEWCLYSNNGQTWKPNGIYSATVFSNYNLVCKERNLILLSDGEMWMDRNGNVHTVYLREDVDLHSTPYIFADKAGNLTWTANGNNFRNVPCGLDLIRKLVFADECTK